MDVLYCSGIGCLFRTITVFSGLAAIIYIPTSFVIPIWVLFYGKKYQLPKWIQSGALIMFVLGILFVFYIMMQIATAFIGVDLGPPMQIPTVY
jgi:hypothetical protein